MKSARLLLKRLAEIAPSGDAQGHNLTIDEGGELVLTLMVYDTFYPIVIGEVDLDKPIHQLVGEIERALIAQITI